MQFIFPKLKPARIETATLGFLDFFTQTNITARRVILQNLIKKCSESELTFLKTVVGMFKSNSTLLSLPNEILLLIFNYLDINDINNVSLANKRLHSVLSDDFFWRRLCLVNSFKPIKSIFQPNKSTSPIKLTFSSPIHDFTLHAPRMLSWAPWKSVYRDGYLTDQNWKNGRYSVRSIKTTSKGFVF